MRPSRTENRRYSCQGEGKSRFYPPLFTFVNKLSFSDLYVFAPVFITRVLFRGQRYEKASKDTSLLDVFSASESI